MSLPTLLIIGAYFLIRVAIPFSDFEKTNSAYTTIICKAYLSCGVFIVGSLSYLSDVLAYTQNPWSVALTPVWMFVGWLVVIVIDSLYQFRMMSSTQLKLDFHTDLEEDGALGETNR
jgi:quinol-cytochrome oxidoreductase complex cytochrome b subunit